MLKNNIKLLVGFFLMTNAFAEAVLCPPDVTLFCPANSQRCEIVSVLPGEWAGGGEGYSNLITSYDRQEVVKLTHATYIDNPTRPTAECLYGIYTSQDPTGSVYASPTSLRSGYPSGSWAKVDGNTMHYTYYECPGVNRNYPISASTCPFNLN